MEPVPDIVDDKLTPLMSSMLSENFRREEIEEALKQMHPTKAPGPDGMCALFYQKYWNTIGHDICEEILEILNNGVILVLSIRLILF